MWPSSRTAPPSVRSRNGRCEANGSPSRTVQSRPKLCRRMNSNSTASSVCAKWVGTYIACLSRGGTRQASKGRVSPASREDFGDDVAVDVGQAEVAALEFERQFLVVDAEQLQHRRVQV